MTSVKLACRCGKVTGRAQMQPLRQRVVCYCKDCQAFAHFLERPAELLDPWGGTDIFQITPSQLSIESGKEHIAAMRLSPKGLYRFHTTCCDSPIANAVAPGMAFHGVLSTMVVEQDEKNGQLGPVDYRVHGEEAQGKPAGPAVHPTFPLMMMMRFLSKLIWYRLRGLQQPSPFFTADGEVAVPVRVLSKKERHTVTP